MLRLLSHDHVHTQCVQRSNCVTVVQILLKLLEDWDFALLFPLNIVKVELNTTLYLTTSKKVALKTVHLSVVRPLPSVELITSADEKRMSTLNTTCFSIL